jgi:cobalamin biosynthesis protein CbiG
MVKPAQIVAGIGCRRGTTAEEIVGLIQAALDIAGFQPSALLAIATLDRKATEPGLLAAAGQFGIPVRTFAAAQLAHAPAPAAPAIEALIGVHSVAEAAAGRAGPLILAKQKSAHATCALAIIGPGFDLASFGQFSTAATAASRSLTSSAGP